MKRVVITGMGAVTPVVVGVSAYWKNLMAGRCGIGEITQFDAADQPIRRAAEVHDFHPKDFMPTNAWPSTSSPTSNTPTPPPWKLSAKAA